MSLFGLFDSPILFKDQDYIKLKQQCLNQGHFFVDPTFPADNSSLFCLPPKDDSLQNIQWKRPGEICDSPFLFVDGITSHDVNQGMLGNCWFVAACTCLAVYKENWLRMIPDYKGQEWDPERPVNYCGIFRFRFWRYGEWTEVVIDDQLPTLNGSLLYCHSKFHNEFWSALLEKAYAKLLGTYEALEGGELAESLVDFTGGIAEPINIADLCSNVQSQCDVFDFLISEYRNKSLIAAAIPALRPEDQEKETEFGLIIGHAYSVTNVRLVSIEDGQSVFSLFKQKTRLRMIRLRNPWGQGEWNGAFSDGSKEWQAINRASRTRIGLIFEDDGEFWMTLEDFLKNFNSIVICRLMNTSLFTIQKTWCEAIFHGAWYGYLTGGCLNEKSTFLNNPQYIFDIMSDEGDDVQMFLTQKKTREMERSEGATGLLHIGFTILKVEMNRVYRVHRLDHTSTEVSSVFKNGRSIFLRHHLRRGRYVLIPCTFSPGQEEQFLLRMYTSKASGVRELVEDVPRTNLCGWICKYPDIATRLTLYRAENLERVLASGGANPYCCIECEDEKVYTTVCTGTLQPIWNDSFLFFRKNPYRNHITIQVFSKNKLIDDFLGRQVFYFKLEKPGGETLEMDLLPREGDKGGKMKGKLFCEITSFKTSEFIRM